MAVLIGPIRAQFDISDFQYSLLHGFAFSMFYIALGLPIARLADQRSRKWIITAGILLWSIMTCLCGMTKSFAGLFFARVGVGVGEAALSPPAYSLLADLFSSEKLPRAMAIYTLGITLGGGLAYIVGGAVYQHFAAAGGATLPLIGQVHAWQITFVAVGLPGLLVAGLLSLINEPDRPTADALSAAADNVNPSLGDVAQQLKDHWASLSGPYRFHVHARDPRLWHHGLVSGVHDAHFQCGQGGYWWGSLACCLLSPVASAHSLAAGA